jgi:hypothetical protein
MGTHNIRGAFVFEFVISRTFLLLYIPEFYAVDLRYNPAKYVRN